MVHVADSRPELWKRAPVQVDLAPATPQPPAGLDERFLYSGLIRLHVLHHAAQEPVFGLALIEELARHGYRMSAGTLYPILHGLEERGLLSSAEKPVGRSRRRVYRATAAGHAALIRATHKVRELFSELVEDGPA